MEASFRLHAGDCLARLRELPAESVQCVITSPPYWGLRDYGIAGQLGLEETPWAYVEGLVAVFLEVRRVLKVDGTLWLNLGDSYIANPKGSTGQTSTLSNPTRQTEATPKFTKRGLGLKQKDLVGVPWRVAFALQDEGWYLRSDIIWAKPNPMPESVEDRPTRAHEYLFLLAKSERYYFDAKAIREPAVEQENGNTERKVATAGERSRTNSHLGYSFPWSGETRNRRSVWTITTKPYKSCHFAVMPQDLVEPCILAGSRPGDEVLDPFCGSGTVGVVAVKHGRGFTGIDINPKYIELSRRRINSVAPLLVREIAS